MKAQELRIGNIVEYLIRDEMDAKKEWWEPSQIDAEDILWLSQNPDDEDYRPIPLTEEWLVRFGFNKTDDYGDQVYYENGRYYVCCDHEDWVFGITNGNTYTTLIYNDRCFQYVHQLQNLIFDLTGEELTTTPIQ